MATYTDDFNRASLGSNWAAVNGGTWAISGSTVLQQTQATDTYRALRYTSAMDGADVDVSVTGRGSSAYIGFGILVRMPGSGTASSDIDGYAIVGFPDDTFYLLRFDSGDDGGVGYGYSWGTCNASTDYTLRITVEGTTVTGYVDGTQRFQFTDATYAGGSGQRSVAFISYGSTAQFDNFSAADISSGITGSASLTQAAQTVAAAGAVAIAGAAAITQAGNTVAATGTVPLAGITGSASITQDGQTVSAAGVVAIAGAAAITQAGNVVTAPQSLRFYGNAVSQIDRVRIPLEDGASTQYPVNVGAGDFTVEAWLRCAYADNASTATDEDARYSNIVYDRDSWGEQRGHVWGVTRDGSGNLIVCFGQAGAGTTWATIFSTSDIGDGEWHHVAVTRNQSTGAVTIWVDGVNEASDTYDTSDWSYPAGHTVGSGQDNEYAVIGTEKHDVGYGYNGEVDELRISDSVRYTGTFTPAGRFEPDGDAVGLYHADEGSGTTLVDYATVSGAPTNGELLIGGSPSGPVWVELPAGVVESVAGIVGSASLTQAAQSVAAAGVVAIVGVAAATQDGNTVAADGTVAIIGSAIITQAAQTVSAVAIAGSVPILGSASITQADQTVASVGVVAIVGSASITHDDQTVSAAGTVAIVGGASITQDGQTIVSVGNVAIAGSGSIIQDGNTLNATAIVGNVPILGSASITQAGNTIVASGAVTVAGVASINQAAQSIAASGTVAVVGAASVTQDGNTLSALASVAIVGAASITQDDNTLAATMALDLIIAVVSGAIRGTSASGVAHGVSAVGTTRGMESTGSI